MLKGYVKSVYIGRKVISVYKEPELSNYFRFKILHQILLVHVATKRQVNELTIDKQEMLDKIDN